MSIDYGDDDPRDAYDQLDALVKQYRAPRSGPIWLTHMADILRYVGLNVIEMDGWKTRARSSGGYSDWPLCVMWHHTASGPNSDGWNDANYIASGSSNSPLSNLYINRAGTVWVVAAGATNTNGQGNSIRFSRGTVPQDGMNARALGVEMGNNGVGEQWPRAQIDAMFKVSNAMNLWFGNLPEDISTHTFYAPGRKIDPATANAVAGPWKPKGINTSGSWDRGDIQAECWNRISTIKPPDPVPPNPNPIHEDEIMGMFVLDSTSMGSAMLTVRADGSHFMVGFNTPDERNAWAGVLPVVLLADNAYQSWIDRSN
jgi:hypothetical protein